MTPRAAWRLERRLAGTLWELGRRLVELAYNRLEPPEVKLLPTRLRIGLDEYRRNRRTANRVQNGFFGFFGNEPDDGKGQCGHKII